MRQIGFRITGGNYTTDVVNEYVYLWLLACQAPIIFAGSNDELISTFFMVTKR